MEEETKLAKHILDSIDDDTAMPELVAALEHVAAAALTALMCNASREDLERAKLIFFEGMGDLVDAYRDRSEQADKKPKLRLVH